ncbi:tRNA (guanosine(37)-N1)-methyltransferase TrmD, partial [Candidatus Gottesmanbacteria bacterium]|nr:tRNA (guanosine(37)-N1)-methyltransferase TrmD [Candidatus Gottesmanbacteria bacterium]
MKITILTLFPEMFTGPFDHSIIKRAINKKRLEINLVNIRNFGIGPHKTVDNRPYGGGVGMVMRVDVIDRAIKNIQPETPRQRIVLLDPKGKTFNQAMARRFSKLDNLILVCGHYEGVDERVKKLVDETISIGNYVLTGGEIPAMVIVDSAARLIPSVLAKKEATIDESFSRSGILEYPQYTRPPEYQDLKVPKILLS